MPIKKILLISLFLFIYSSLNAEENLKSVGKYKDWESFILLKEVIKKLSGENYKILNIDSTIILEAPPISKFIDSMVEAISNEVGLYKNRISIKATTNDGLGFIGRGEGISVITTSLIIKD